MLFSEMSQDQLWEIINNDLKRLKTARYYLTLCLVAKIKYLLSLLDQDYKYKELINSVYSDYKESETDVNGIPTGGYNPWSEENLNGLQDVDMFWRDGYHRSNGVYVSGHWVSSHNRYR
ncbi:hypothetical protein [Aliivibrio sifiae]|uniref:Uncharacterized protein n=1 Tax=Aliivibrio sifiae TaxID=566293 RepID=A0A2S7X7W7_9GAMM|nr:hypothetical protein [Aliivibrio sifiae]PQJ87439.1 hypothetical protein BTO23_15105 [Aliivibrio sifiae]GLR77229.1 hypothetical protein GCM10007855_41040 [Aliivibrio sifiae]